MNQRRRCGRASLPGGTLVAFTLVELLVSMSVLVLLMVMLVTISDQVTRVWRSASSRSETFREARDTFEAMTRRLSQATLNTYYDYYDAHKPPRLRTDSYYTTGTTAFVPSTYLRTSELRFISGLASTLIPATNNDDPSQPPPLRATHAVFFQAPLGYTETKAGAAAPSLDFVGLSNMLNTWGYYTEYTSDKSFRPSFLSNATRNRFRLMELNEAAETLTVYGLTSGHATLLSTDPNGMKWFQTPLASVSPVRTHVLAENIVALIIQPQLSRQDVAARHQRNNDNLLSPNYSYDSTLSANYPGGTLPLDENGKADAGVNPKAQLPPVVQATIIAIDETSAQRVELLKGAGKTAVQVLGLDTYFASTTDPAANYETDLQAVMTKLSANRLTYRVFSSQIPIRTARWSTGQKN